MGNRFPAPRTVVITGAASGIGRAAAEAFAREGDTVVMCDLDAARLETVARGIPGAIACVTDICDSDSTLEARDAALSATGSIDVLVNNAMVCVDGSLLDLSEADLRRQLEVNLLGHMLMTRAVLPAMIDQGAGVVLNLASVNALSYLGNVAYSAAKAGLLSLTQSIAVEYGPRGVRSVALAPGTIRTEFWQRRVDADPAVFEKATSWYPIGRVGEPEDVVAALLFLASPQASWISGCTLPVDGGLTAGNGVMAAGITPSGRLGRDSAPVASDATR